MSDTITIPRMEIELKPGITLWFGRQNTVWRVLEVDREHDTALLIAEKPVCNRSFHKTNMASDWERCDLRAWLNSEYFDTSFSDEEKAGIVETRLTNPDNPQYNIPGGNDTVDRIFLLSIDEANKYFKDDADRVTDSWWDSWWWLRSPGYFSNIAAIVYSNGNINHFAGLVYNDNGGVRPAFKINLKSEIFRSCILSESEGSVILSVPQFVVIDGVLTESHKSLICADIPEGVTGIREGAFDGCKNLQLAVFPRRNDIWHVPGLSLGVMTTEGKRAYYAYTGKNEGDNLSTFAKEGYWADYDRELINNGPAFRYKTPARLLGALGRLLDPTELAEENRALLAEMVTKNAKKLIQIAEDTKHPEIAADLVSLLLFDEKTAKALKKRLAASPVPEIAALAETEVGAARIPAPEEKPADPLREEYAEKLRAVNGDAAIKKMKLLGTAVPKLKLADGSEAPEDLFRFLLVSYGTQSDGKYRLVPEADKGAKLLAYDSLCEAMETVSGHLNGPDYPAVLPLLCRYGNAKQIRALIKASGNWAGAKGRKASEILYGALALSETREAVVALEKIRALDSFAALRGITRQEVYDRYLFDFGFDENGKRIFDLGTTAVEVTLTSELTLRLWDTARGKEIRQLPKKGADPAVWQAAADELADMRQNLKNAVKIKNGQLWADYLESTEIPSDVWERSYTGNAFLRAVGSLLVWEQSGEAFVLSAGRLLDSAGRSRTLMDAPVRIAHPMEMAPEDVKAWQKYFTAHGLKQPFAQVWEPVIDFDGVKPDRYKDCRINPLYLKNQQKRGIAADWYSGAYSISKYVNIEGFEVRAADAPAEIGDRQQYLQIVSIVPEHRNRRANMVLGYLDRITVYGRLRKDDVSVMDRMDDFTLAQVAEFISAAQEAQAVNVLALLLEYRNTHFADYDPMDEFTLDLD